MKLKLSLTAALLGLTIAVCPALYFLIGPALSASQARTLLLLLCVAGGAALFCFVTGELSGNNSQMDKLWSLLPPVYVWIAAIRGGLTVRLVVMAVLVTLWGARLTFNFARKGAYRLKFWEGREDYRWAVLREKPGFRNRWVWALFDLFFISIYQNLLVLATTLPALLAMDTEAPFGWVDVLGALLMTGAIVLETVADEQQWRFHSEKRRLMKDGKALEDLPEPYRKGFNTTGIWSRSRHPNYLGEQSTWVFFYLFSVGAGAGILNWSLIGALLLIALFLGSSAFGEEISGSKYPEYARYRERVNKYFPGRKYEP